jgi:hypothetical protein
MVVIKDMKNEIVNRAQYPRKPGSPLNEKFKNMAQNVFGECMRSYCVGIVVMTVVTYSYALTNYALNCSSTSRWSYDRLCETRAPRSGEG